MGEKVYFHEDDYCMIAIMPAENYEFCEDRATQAKEFSSKHRAENGYGWTDVFELKAEPKPLKDCKISVAAFEKILSSAMKKSNTVYTGYSTHEEKCEHTSAFVKDKFHVFYEFEDDLIVKIWLHLDVVGVEDKTAAATLLQALSQAGNLILVDNYKNEVVPLNNEQAINDYLHFLYIHNHIVLNQGKSAWGKVCKDKDGHIIICFTNSDLIEISKDGIKYDSFTGSHTSFVSFQDCANNYFSLIKKGTGKCVGERDITAAPPYIEFCAEPIKIRMLFVNTKKGLFKNFRDDSRKQFHKVCDAINANGFSTFDLS